MKILIFCFGWWNNQTQVEVLKKLKNDFDEGRFQEFEILFVKGVHKRYFNSLLKKIREFKPDTVIGFGSYRRNAKKIRVETEFINKNGRNSILETGPVKVKINKILEGSEELVISRNAGNGPCNMISYLILNEFPELDYLFFHIPGLFDIEKGKSIIKNYCLNPSTKSSI